MLLCTLGLNLVLISIISLLLAALFSVLTGAYFIQALAERLDQLLGNPLKSGKQSNCVILLFSHLYNYRVCVCFCVWFHRFLVAAHLLTITSYYPQVIHCLLIYDIIRRLVKRFTEQDVELLLLLLKSMLTHDFITLITSFIILDKLM